MAVSQEGTVGAGASQMDGKEGIERREALGLATFDQALHRGSLASGSAQSPAERHHAVRQGDFSSSAVSSAQTRHRRCLARGNEAQLIRQAEQVDFAQLRTPLLENAANRTVMLGAFVSLEWLEAYEDKPPRTGGVLDARPRHRALQQHILVHVISLHSRSLVKVRDNVPPGPTLS